MSPTSARWRRSIIGLILGTLMTCGAAPPTTDHSPVEWIRRNARPFATCEPGGTDRDLASLRGIVGDARVVALGEVSNGTHEFFQMKRRIVEYLATHMEFTLFALEANMPEAYQVNEYVLTGRGDPKTLVRRMAEWKKAREFLDFIEWMRAFNQSGKGRVQFLGFDMQTTTDSAATAVAAFVARTEPAYLDSVTRAYRLVAGAPRQEASGSAPAQFPASVAAGHKVRLSAWIRTENLHDGYAAVWWRADAGEKHAAVLASLPNREISGTTPWTPYDTTFDMPANTTKIFFGCRLEGGGTAWFDSLAVEIDGHPFAGTADLDPTMERTDQLVGFVPYRGGGRYTVDLDSTTVLAGKRSLRIRRVAPDAPPATATWPEASTAAARVLEHLEAGRSRFASSSDPADVNYALLNARAIAQISEVHAGARRRELIMAENVARFLDQAPAGSKMVLWAGNLRLARGQSVGAHLASRYGRKLVVFGFAFHEGRYAAVTDMDHPGANDATPSAPGSLEWACHSTGIPRFIVDLRSAAADPRASAWLAQPLPMRNFVFRAVPDTIPVGQNFDALIYFDHTTPSVPLQ